jgi:hypothetical protein
MAPLNYEKIFRVVLLGLICTLTAAQLLKKRRKNTHLYFFICQFENIEQLVGLWRTLQ